MQPVRYGAGELQLSETDITFSGFGLQWGHTRNYTHVFDTNYSGPNGASWCISNIPILYGAGGDNVMVFFSNNLVLYFTRVSATAWAPMFNVLSSLRHDATKQEFILTDKNGAQTLFYDQTVSGRSGLFKGLRNPAGDEFLAQLEATTNRILSISRTVNGKVSGIFYSYIPSGDVGAGLLASVTLRLNDTDARRASYAYYAAGSSGGSVTDLKQVAIEQFDPASAAWGEIGRTYYRYYIAGQSDGFVHGLKFVVNSEAIARLTAAGLSTETATDVQLANFADLRFYFDAQRRVVREDVAAGTATYTFAYSGAPTGATWSMQTTETLPDGAQNIVYSNNWVQTVFRIYKIGTNEWYSAFSVDSNGNYVMQATSAAIQKEASPQLYSLRSNEGLVKRWSYYYQDSGQPPAPNNALAGEFVCKGGSGAAKQTMGYSYASQDVGGSRIWVLSDRHEYLTDDSVPVVATTHYDYTFFAGTLQMQTRTTTLPAVPTAQNGSNVTNTTAEIFDLYGRLIWRRDARGFLTAYVTDPVTGAHTRRIDDVKTSILPCPAGWTTPDGGGLHLITDYELDLFGREIASYGPWHEIDRDGVSTRIRRASWSVYRDAAFETWSASGYVTGAAPAYATTVVNPVSIMRTDRDGRVTDEIVATRGNAVETSGRLSPTVDAFPQPTWVRWTSTRYDKAYRTEWRRLYFDIPDTGDGVPSCSYGQTEFGYDALGRMVRQKTPGGTITRTVYYGPGWNAQTWVGTDDTGATADSPGGAAPNNMTKITERTYDQGGAGGNGNVTTVRAWHSAADPNNPRVTNYQYDWRDRRTVTNGPAGFNEFYTVDFRGLVIATERRDGTLPTSTLLMRSTTDFDVLGRTWKRSVYSVEGGVAGNSISELFWYDKDGTLICRRPLTGNSFEKSAFDSVGRLERTATTVRTGLPTYAQAGNLDADTVTEQTKFYYDDAGNQIKERHRERNHDATGTGNLKGQVDDGQPAARTLYTCSWSDGVGRTVAVANYGTNGGEKVDRPDLIPASTPICLVSQTRYNARGEAWASVDPAGKTDVQEYDDAGRLVKTVENYQP